MPIALASMPIVTPGISHDDARLPPREHGRIRRRQPRPECGSAITQSLKAMAQNADRQIKRQSLEHDLRNVRSTIRALREAAENAQPEHGVMFELERAEKEVQLLE